MPQPRPFGYERRSDDCVLITHQCRLVATVRGDDPVRALVAELGGDDPQSVLARWSTGDREMAIPRQSGLRV
jgi:hypothetical protein